MKPIISIIALVIFYAVGLGMMLLGNPFAVLPYTPLILLLSLAILLINYEWSTSSWVLLIPLTGGFLIEVVGVNTGYPFGFYHYGNVLGIKLWRTPLIIGVNWLLLCMVSVKVASQWVGGRQYIVMTAALIMTALDFIIEPVAIHFHFWAWSAKVPPLQNYLSWLIISALFVTPLYKITESINHKVAWTVLLTQAIFFGLLFLRYG